MELQLILLALFISIFTTLLISLVYYINVKIMNFKITKHKKELLKELQEYDK